MIGTNHDPRFTIGMTADWTGRAYELISIRPHRLGETRARVFRSKCKNLAGGIMRYGSSLSAKGHPPQAHDNFRVILKLDDGEVEIGSIGIQHGGAWAWGIDTVIPMRAFETQGEVKDRSDCMRQFRAASRPQRVKVTC